MTHNPKYADKQLSEAIAGAQDTIFHKLTKPKSRIELCSVMTWNDEELGDLSIFYRVIDAPKSNQTDDSSDCYTIECVKLGETEIIISGRMEQEILEHLNIINPLNVKFL